MHLIADSPLTKIQIEPRPHDTAHDKAATFATILTQRGA